MPVILPQHYVRVTTIVVLALSGCQLPSGKWSMGQNERTRSSSVKPEGIASHESGSTKPFKSAEQMDELIQKGDAHRKNKQYEEARQAYQRALALSPQSPDIHHRLAIVADKQKKYSVADQHYEAALKAHPNDANLLSDLGYSYSLRGSTDKAEKMLKKALSIDAAHKGAMANLGSIYAKQDRYSEAQALFRAGTSEQEAQQYLSQLFPDRARPDAKAKPGRGRSGGTDLIASSSIEDSSDLSNISLEELRAEMERRKKVDKAGTSFVSSNPNEDFDAEPTGQTAQVSWDAQEDPANDIESSDEKPQGVPVPSGKNRVTGKLQKFDSQVQPARGQSAIASLDLIPSDPDRAAPGARPTPPRALNLRSSSQRATEFALGAGPGNLFSIVPGIEMPVASEPVGVTTNSPEPTDELSEPASERTASTSTEMSRTEWETGTEWDQTVVRRPSSTAPATAAPSPIEQENGNTQPYQGLWPNSNQLPVKGNPDPALNPLTSERPKTTGSATRSPTRLASRSSWNDTVSIGESPNRSGKERDFDDSTVSDDQADSWPYVKQQ